MGVKYDFSGYATKNDLKCSDGRTIRKNAFIENDGTTVPLVWQHRHDDPTNVLGHALLENRDDGVYAYGTFNDTAAGQHAKAMVEHGDVVALSIYANKLKQYGGDVLHGAIREVSLVLAGANPGALIDFPILAHSGEESETEAIIYTDELIHRADSDDEDKKDSEEEIETKDDEDESKEEPEKDSDEEPEDEEKKELKHEEKDMADDDRTIQDVFDSFDEDEKNVVYYMIAQAVADATGSATEEDDEEGDDMKHNVFDNEAEYGPVLSHSDIQDIFANARRGGSLRDAFYDYIDGNEELAHAITDHNGNQVTYGIANIDYLFPEARTINSGGPEFIKRPDEWVSTVMSGVHHTPFSRIKSIFADITMEDARARGYTKGNRKIEEVFSVLKRETTPTTIYKKQKLDRDDVLDITDFDVVSYLKAEMRGMLDEEIARAILVGDGRSSASNDKINELNIRPIWTEDPLFTISRKITFANSDTDETKAAKFIREAIKARKDYRGSGNPTLFTTEDWLTEMLLLEDGVGRPLYQDVSALATKMRVSKIVSVPVMENLSRTIASGADAGTWNLMGIIVNLNDYNVGADKGGEVNMFDDFDIDFNQMKYLIETRCSGAMIKPYSAIALEYK